MSSLDLSECRKNLNNALGDSMKVYLHLLMQWFKRKISREDFDHEARRLLPVHSVQLHNQFLLAIMGKCQSLAGVGSARSESATSSTDTRSSPGKVRKTSSARTKRRSTLTGQSSRSGFQQRFCPVNPLQQALPINLPEPEPDGKALTFASREMSLPDIGMVHGRMIVTAWDFGLEDVADNAVRTMMQAIEVALKNIITAVLCRRNAYRLREGKFRFGIGTQQPLPALRNTANLYDAMQYSEATTISSKGVHIPSIKFSQETGQRDAALDVACTGPMPPAKPPISLWNLLETLRVHRSAIPSHTVYASNMERIMTRLWHPSPEQHKQDVLHKEEAKLKAEMAVNSQLVLPAS